MLLPSIRERNQNFDSLCPSEQRVAVAKDIIAQLDTKNLVAKNGSYIAPGVGRAFYKDELHGVPNVEAFQEECRVCAIGAAAMSILNGEAIHVLADKGDNGLLTRLSDVFPRSVLRSIESAFESTAAFSREKARALFGVEYPLADAISEREWKQSFADFMMRLVWQHVIDNNGDFPVHTFPTHY